MKLKRILAVFTVLIITAVLFINCSVVYGISIGGKGFPPSIDLSRLPCFPPVGDQNYLNSCSSFATTYYQYTYEVNRLNGVTNKKNLVVYSPKWTYNLSNNSCDMGSGMLANYKVLMDFGCLKNDDFPYTGRRDDYTDIPYDMRDKKREALFTRVSAVYRTSISNKLQITSPNSMALNLIKKSLSNGKLLTALTKGIFNSYYDDESGRCIVYRCTGINDYAHSVTIVGYDDTIEFDINNNGKIEQYEKGAFKVVNSWGKDYDKYGLESHSTKSDGTLNENAGYFWVMYDALNLKSANKVNNWERRLSGVRYPAFSNSFTSNGESTFYKIDVAHKSVRLVGELTISTEDREGIMIQYNVTPSFFNIWKSSGAVTLGNFDMKYADNTGEGKNVPYAGYILFDFGKFTNNTSLKLDRYSWSVFISFAGRTYDNMATLKLTDGQGRGLTGYKFFEKDVGGIMVNQRI